MLIDSPRLTDADRAHWNRLARYDTALAADPRLSRLTEQATAAIASFAATPCYLGVSWGKDSTVVAHLARDSDIPLVWLRTHRWDNPDCEAARDAYLARHPGQTYHEIPIDPDGINLRWRLDEGHLSDAWRDATRTAAARFGDRYITGIRAAESSQRALSARTHGVATDRVCRPILRWETRHVWAYLTRHDLPIHPAYAQTGAGAWDRDRIRVGSLGGNTGTGHGRAEWEQTYYADTLRGAA